jgi:hypothetical protein
VLHGAYDATVVAVAAVFPDGPCRALYVGTGGDVTIAMLGGTVVEFVNVASGTTLDVQATEVTAVTGADDILALY